jgi:hypothetical protein
MRLIDADAAIDRYYAEYKKQDICDGGEDRDWLKRCIDEAPTIEAEPVRHGRWIKRPDERICPFCNDRHSYFGGKEKNYCPNCGAKMDGDSHD